MSQYNGVSPTSLVYVSKPQTVRTAIEGKYNFFLNYTIIQHIIMNK